MMWGYGTNQGWGGGLFMGFGMLVGLALLGLLIWALARWMSNSTAMHGAQPAQSLSAMDVLDQRYARGEIDAATFEQMRERLSPAQHTGQPVR